MIPHLCSLLYAHYKCNYHHAALLQHYCYNIVDYILCAVPFIPMTCSALLFVYSLMVPSISARIVGIFVKPNKKISISGTFLREHLTRSYNKMCTIFCTYVIIPFFSSTALTYFVNILSLQTNSWKFGLPLSAVVLNKNKSISLSQVLSSAIPKATDPP